MPTLPATEKKLFNNLFPRTRYLLKCGCCGEKVEIYYGDDGLEINGVNGTIEDWREILLPLLLIEQQGEQFVDQRNSKADSIGRRDASVDARSSDG
jgi:hypothetical protein